MKRLLVILISLAMSFGGISSSYAEEPTEWEKQQEERRFNLDKQKLLFEKEKWEHEKAESARKEYESTLSTLCDVKANPPVFKIIGHIGGTDRNSLMSDLQKLYDKGVRKVVIYVASGGGDAFAGLGVADVIEHFKARGMILEGRAYSLVASAAVPIFASCSVRVSSKSTLFMVHEAALYEFIIGVKQTTKSDVEGQNEMFDKLHSKYIDKLVRNSDKSKEFWESKIKETSWFFSEEALEWGLVDKIE